MNSVPVSGVGVPVPVSTFSGHAGYHASGAVPVPGGQQSPGIVPVFHSKVANMAINQFGQPVVLIENQALAQAKNNMIYVKPVNSSQAYYQVNIPNLHDCTVDTSGYKTPGGSECSNQSNNDHVLLQCKHPGCYRQIKVPDLKFRGYDFFEPASMIHPHQIPAMFPAAMFHSPQPHPHQGQVMFYNYNQNVQQQPVQQQLVHQQCTVEEIKEGPSTSAAAAAITADNANENKKGKKFVKYNNNYNKPQHHQQNINNKPQQQQQNLNNRPHQQKQQHHKPFYCKFCCDNRESEETYSSHNTKDENGVVTCPILKKRVCEKCRQSGHTRGYCTWQGLAAPENANH